MRAVWEKYRDVILYLLFGGGTTLINLAVYWLCYDRAGWGNLPSVAAAWALSVAFAFATNRTMVFHSQARNPAAICREALSFFGCRLATGVLDAAVMAFAVDMMNWNGMLWKMLSNIVVIVLNYAASKLLIFRRHES